VTALAGAAGLLSLAEHKGQGDTHLSTPGPVARLCMCPDDCGCHYPWRATVCGCRAHVPPTVPEHHPDGPVPAGMCNLCRQAPALTVAEHLPGIDVAGRCKECSRA
jgi:hypothetical protein